MSILSNMDDDSKADTDDADKGMNTGWSKEPTILDLKQDLADSQSDHSAHVAQVDIWLDNLNVTGNAALPKVKNKSNIVPKVIRKQAEWRYASLSEPFLSTEDLFNVAPVTFEDKAAAEQNALVLNYQFNHKIQKVTFIDEFIRTAVDEGTVVLRVGWDFEEKEVEVEIPTFKYITTQDPQAAQQMQMLIQMAQQNPEEFNSQIPKEIQHAVKLSVENGVIVQAEQSGTTTEMQIQTVKNIPTIDVCDYNNVHIDPSCKGDLTKANFVIYSFETSLSELEKDGKYKNLDKINVDGNSILSTPDHVSQDESCFNFSW